MREPVPGDIIRLEAGDFVPADSRLLHSAGLKSEESALTGESVPSEKDYLAEVKDGAPIGDRFNMVYSGCSITYGTATAVVTATGMDTEMGKIANLLDNGDDGQTIGLQNIGIVTGALLKCLSLIMPLILGFVFAIILSVPMNFFEKNLFSKTKKNGLKKIKRPLSFIISIILILAIIVGVVWLVIPELVDVSRKISKFVVDTALDREGPKPMKGTKNPNDTVVPEALVTELKKCQKN